MDWLGWVLVALWALSAIVLVVIVGGLITGRLFTDVPPGESPEERVDYL
jgi:hypothetical protein